MGKVVWSMEPYSHRYVLERSMDGGSWRPCYASDDLASLQKSASSWAADGFYVRILDRGVSE